MKELSIKGTYSNSRILVGERLENLKNYIPDNTIIITDEIVYELYKDSFPKAEVIVIGCGEKIKNLDTVNYIIENLVSLETDRSAFIVGIGGGIVCDITGFVASIYLRGLRFGFVSTTLLSQVDASVGGKNGVNFNMYKNYVGVFNQPEFVICDQHMLKTLPPKELLCGFGEIVKHACIKDAAYFNYIEENADEALKLNSEVIEKLVYDSVVIKSDVVNQDEREKGERRKLNFGHTFGHAFEKSMEVLHGEAVSMGMMVALSLSEKKGLLASGEVIRIVKLLKSLGLPTEYKMEKAPIIDAFRKDKKRERDSIKFVLLNKIGEAIIEDIPILDLEKVVDEL